MTIGNCRKKGLFMEYPGAKFVRPIRVGMLLLFIAAFFVIAPTVILYSAGYRYDFQNGLLKETGSLSIDVLPKTATAYLDGVKIDQTMPVRLNNITPHKYTLQISAPGFYDWEKQIEVNRNQTTYIKEMVLIKKDKQKLVTKDQASELSISDSGRYLAYAIAGKNETSVFIGDEQAGTASLAAIIPGSNKLKMDWSPNANYLAIGYLDKPGLLKIINASVPIKVADPGVNIKGDIQKFMWSKDSEPQIYFEAGGMIYSFMPRLQQTSLVTSNIYIDWYLDDGRLWTIRFNTTTPRLEIIQDTLGFNNVFATLPTSDSEPSSTLLGLKFSVIYGKTVVLKDQASSRYQVVRQNENFFVPGNNLLLSRYSNWLITWTPWELWTYSEGDRPFLLNRSGTELANVQPLDQFNTLGLHADGEITALYPYFFIQRNLVSHGVKVMAADPISRTLYYSNASGLWKLGY